MHHIRHAPTSFMRLFRIDPAACRRMFDPLDERTGDTAVQYRAEPRPPSPPEAVAERGTVLGSPIAAYHRAGTARGRMTDQPTLGEMFTHHRDRLKTAAWQMAVDGQREGGGPMPRRTDTDAFIDRLADRLLRPQNSDRAGDEP